MKTRYLALVAMQICALAVMAAPFERYEKSYTRPGRAATLTLTVDYPQTDAGSATGLCDWLLRLADKSFVPGRRFTGDKASVAEIGAFVANKFFTFADRQAGADHVNPYHYYYSLTVETAQEQYVTYRLRTRLEYGQRVTMLGDRLITYFYGAGELTNDMLFRHSKFKSVKQTLLRTAFADSAFMELPLVSGEGITKWQHLRPLFCVDGDDSWNGMLLPPSALLPSGVAFSVTLRSTPAAIIVVPYTALEKDLAMAVP